MQLPDGAFPRNGLLNGKAAPDTGGLQLDETADPILAAWEAGMGGDASLYTEHIKPAADFLVANGPETSGSVERWEEQTGYSASTMADEVAGLVAAASIATKQGDTASARLFLASADNFRQLILATTVTTNGPLSSSPYFIRVDKTGDPNDDATFTLGNGNETPVDQRTVIDQGFVELTRLGELPASDPLVTNSLAVVSKAIDVTTPTGTGVLRYNGDGYGDCEAGTVTDPVNHTTSTCTTTGAPWAPTDTGTGHPWPVLSGENGEYQVLAGDTGAAQSDLDFMLNSASGVGLVPEQVWDFPDVAASPYGSDPTTASIGFTDGQADGSAAPLTWAQAQLLRLIRDMSTGQLVDQPSIVANRYLKNPPAVAHLAVTAPLAVKGGNVPANMERPSVTIDAASTTVKGRTKPGATVDVAVTGTAPGASAPQTTITTVTAASTGKFAASVSLEFGTNSIEVATTAGRATGEALFSVTNLRVPGTVVLQVPSEADGGYGPGTYAYPTATNSPGVDTFPAGAFKLSGLTVINSGATVTFQVGLANLVPTFGSADGAQLIDLYIHNPTPGSQVQSTAAAGAWNYSIASGDAWNQLIEVDGFGTDDWVTPSSTTAGLGESSSIGTPQVTVSSLPETSNGYTPGLVSITVPTSALGTPGPGWTFTLALAGQNGEGGNDDARTFTATPGAYTFGVCSAAVAGEPNPPAICSYNPNNVPIVLDTIPPSGVDVQSELNPTLPANATGVQLQGVTVP
jgi:glucodextranase-like protein/glycosyl hydrolase family 15